MSQLMADLVYDDQNHAILVTEDLSQPDDLISRGDLCASSKTMNFG